MSLTERRAEFVYNGARLAAIAAQAPIVPVTWNEREDSFRTQFLNVIERQCGPQRSNSPEELHGSWMADKIKALCYRSFGKNDRTCYLPKGHKGKHGGMRAAVRLLARPDRQPRPSSGRGK